MTRSETLLRAIAAEVARRKAEVDADRTMRSVTVTVLLDRDGHAARAIEWTAKYHRELL